jgi:ATP-dependent RNA helicase DeaD
MKFSETGLNKELLKSINSLGYEVPTPIQEQVIPYLLKEKRDLVALAQTGTGKTASFGLPILQKIEIKTNQPQAIILSPTRELCIQITNDIKSYATYLKKINITAVYGGANIQTQIKSLKQGSQIVVGTPGRVIDLIKRKVLKLHTIKYVVLDEADEMLNMGFKEDLDTILSSTPNDKQSLLFSATMPKEVLRISKNYMSNPNKIEVAKRNQGADNVEHFYYMVNARDKYKALRRICDMNPEIYGIVFCRTRRETKDIADKLMQDKYSADALHGDLSQAQRDHVMNRFRKRHLQLLVATDVAARGIDINELSHVINYNLPDDNEVYIHRSGRTGRAGNKGVSLIIAHSREGRKIKAIEKMINKELILKKVPAGKEICQAQLMKLIEKVVNTEVNPEIADYITEIEKKLKHLKKSDLIKHFVSVEFNRFLSFYKNSTDLNIKEKTKKNSKKGHAERGYSRFFINLGKVNRLETHNLIGLINEYTKERDIPIGKIDILRKFSFFEIDSEYENLILEKLANAKWNNHKISVELSKPPSNKENSYKKEKNSFKKKKKYSQKRNAKKSSFKDRFKKRR